MSRLRRLLKPESRDRQELRLQLAPPEAMNACRGAIEDIGWAAVAGAPEETRLTAHEDLAKLCCGDSPVRLEIELEPDGRGSTVSVEGIVPGVGGVATKHLRLGMRAFALGLARRGQTAASE